MKELSSMPTRTAIREKVVTRTLTGEEAFTIIELLTVAVLLAMLSAILYSSLTAVLNGRELVTAKREVTLVAEHIFSQLTTDLTARESIPLERDDTPQAGGSAFRGFGVKRYMASKNASKQNAAADSLVFVTHSFPISVVSQAQNFGMVEVQYRIEELPRELQLEQETTTRFRLLREERPAAVSEKKTREEHRVVTILSDSIVDFNLRYLLNEKWQDEWSGTSGRAFPEAIEITLGLIDSEQVEHRFRTAVAISKRQN